MRICFDTLFEYLQYLEGEIIVEEELFVDYVGQVATQVRQLQVVGQLQMLYNHNQLTISQPQSFVCHFSDYFYIIRAIYKKCLPY
jgi:hypothetical protein